MPPKKANNAKPSSSSVATATSSGSAGGTGSGGGTAVGVTIKPADGLWLFTALQHTSNPAFINILTASHALKTKPHNITCKLSDLRKRYGLNIAGTSSNAPGPSSSSSSSTSTAEKTKISEVRPADLDWFAKVIGHCTASAVQIHVPSVAEALGTKPHNVTCRISALKKAYGLKISGYSAGGGVGSPAGPVGIEKKKEKGGKKQTTTTKIRMEDPRVTSALFDAATSTYDAGPPSPSNPAHINHGSVPTFSTSSSSSYHNTQTKSKGKDKKQTKKEEAKVKAEPCDDTDDGDMSDGTALAASEEEDDDYQAKEDEEKDRMLALLRGEVGDGDAI